MHNTFDFEDDFIEIEDDMTFLDEIDPKAKKLAKKDIEKEIIPEDEE